MKKLKLMNRTVSVCVTLLLLIISSSFRVDADGDDDEDETRYLYNKIYKSLDQASPCFRLLGWTSPIGCAAKDAEGPSGEFLELLTQDAVNEFSVRMKSKIESSFIAVIAPALFVRKNIEMLLPEITSKTTLKSPVQGFLVLHPVTTTPANITKPKQWSPELENPNREYGLYPNSTVIWNPIGDGMTYMNVPVPIFLLTLDESLYVLSLVKENQEKKNLGSVDSFAMWGAQLNAFMFGTHNAETCLRRDECDPLGGQSVWGVIPNQPVDRVGDNDGGINDEIILVMSGMSGTSYFKYEAAAADSDISSIVATLSAIHSLFLLKSSGEEEGKLMKRKIMFAMFEGEGYGYIGSKRFVRDVLSRPSSFASASSFFDPSTFFSQIRAIVNPNQVGLATSGQNTVYVHSEDSGRTKFIFDAMKNASLGSNMKVEMADGAANNNEIPPSSAMSFLSYDRTIPSVVVTDHSTSYQNKYFGSRFDNFENINYDMVCDAATLLTRTLFLLSTQSYVDPSFLNADCSLVNEVLDCFLKDNNCSLLRTFQLNRGVQSDVESNYVGVYGGGSMRLLPAFVFEFLANTSAISRFSSPECDCNNTNPLCIADTCMNAPYIQKHTALSPDVVVEDGIWKVVQDSDNQSKQPMWVESRWIRYGVRVFQLEHPKTSTYLFVFGFFELLISIAISYFIRSYFIIPTPSSPPS